MKRLFSRASRCLGVVIPAWGVEDYLDDCLRSLVAQTHRRWEAVVVDDGATDRTGEIADAWARRDNRISVVHSVNGGPRRRPQRSASSTCAATSSPSSTPTTSLPPTAYADLVGALHDSGSDFATGSIVRWEGDRPGRAAVDAAPAPAACGVRASRTGPSSSATSSPGTRSSAGRGGTRAACPGPRGCATRTSPPRRGRSSGAGSTCSTRSSTAGGSARARSPRPGRRRCRTSPTAGRPSGLSLASVRDHGSAEVEAVFLDRVLAGDLWRYFLLVPGCTPEWWRLLRSGVLELWGRRSLVHSGLPPVHRLAGWLVEQDRRADVTALMEWVATLDGPAPRVQDVATGAWRLSRAALGARRGHRGSRSAGAAGPRGRV